MSGAASRLLDFAQKAITLSLAAATVGGTFVVAKGSYNIIAKNLSTPNPTNEKSSNADDRK